MTCSWRSTRGAAMLCLVLVASILLLCGPGCASQPLTVTREPVTVRLVTADSCTHIVEEAARAYEAARPWVTVTSEVFNNALATDVLWEDEADLALLSWGSATEGEQPLWTEPFARDGIAVIVHPTSPFLETGLAELREVFRGRLQVREGSVLTVVSREEGSGTRAAFEEIVLEGEGTTRNAVVLPSSEAVVDYVASTPSAIGYASMRCLDERVRVLPVEGVLPTQDAIASGSYPLWRQFHLASSGEPVGEARHFAQWLLSRGWTATELTEDD